ncbi:MAG: Ig-like domain repeat protein, partial [Candidatus Bathyarchaeota archaeon]|nr:Ig-like domain repeat protein [Candidatus Bathyarchaeota archaeon]
DASWDVYSETPPSINVWDDNYPSGGNYWSNYLGVDLKSGPSQDQPGSDGLGDVPYIIDDYNRDRYPLVLQPEQPPKPQLVSISPTQGGNTGMVTVRLEGIGLSEVAAVRLVREGYQQIEGLDTTVIGTTQVGTILISTRFDFTGKEPGLWDVLVTLPDSTELRLPEAFTIVSGGQPKLWVDVIGRGRIIFGKNATLGITYGNDGEIDTFDVNLVIRIPSGLKFKVNISPPNVSGVDWERVPLGSLVGSQVVISIWIYHVPAFSTGFFSLTVQAPFTSTELKIRAELWHSQPNKFTQTGDFAFANESSIFSRLVSIYPILLATNFTTLPTTDFANGLLTWLQANQNEIKLLPNAFLSVAAATEILGTPISNTALKLLIDPLASTGSPGPWYGNYCGPGPEPQDWDGDGDIDPDDYMGVNAPPFLDDLDLACKTHDWLYSTITNVKTGETGIGGFWDVWNRVGGTPQDEADWGLVEDAWDFDPSTSYLTETMGEEDGTIAATHIRDAVVISFTAMYLKPHPINLDDDVFAARVGHSFDPNDKAGPSGFGSQRFIPLGRELLYIIFFENLENATAPAEDIVITDQLDSDLDWSTLKFGEISHSQYASTNFNSTTGTITWTFTGINLPPNKNPPEGEGWVIFTIKPKPNLSSGTEIRNKATIVFDINPPMDTPEFLNTIDSQPPSSSVNSLPSQQPLSFEVGWSGTDDAGSGIRDYTIYVSDNDGPCTPWLPRVTNQSAKFTGEIGHTYAFYSIARDNAYNTEEPPTLPDTTVTMDSTPPTIRIPSRMPEGDILPDQSTKVSVNATDAVSGVKNATLSYTTDNGASWTNLSMNYNSSTGLYEATIPFQPAGTWVKYKIIAYDYAGNNATLDGTEPYCTYQVVTEFSSSLILPLFMIITLLAVIVYRRKHSM